MGGWGGVGWGCVGWVGVGWWWWCKVIIVSNPTAVKVELSCIEVVVGVLTTSTTKVVMEAQEEITPQTWCLKAVSFHSSNPTRERVGDLFLHLDYVGLN